MRLRLYIKINFHKGILSKSVNVIKIGLTESVNGGCAMNERSFSLPAEKQYAIINAKKDTDISAAVQESYHK